jgi:peptidoglycan/LPS O-acetylase OafA/YrhL
MNIKNENRLYFLDGMRGIAIILVILYHAFSRWPEHYPYGEQFMNFPLFAYGSLGVELFFIISGFVILMTLEKCTGFTDFMLRRWLRLFSAMLVCSLFVYITSGIFHERPMGIPAFREILPGLTFIEPKLYEEVFHFPWSGLEGAFWSLYIEVKFYMIFAFLYFFMNSRIAIFGLIGLFVLNFIVMYEDMHIAYLNIMREIMFWLSAKYFGWFATGAIFYKYYQNKNRAVLLFALLVGLLSAFAENTQFGVRVCGSLIVLFFAISIINGKINLFLSNKLFIFIGFISYPLYLLHENITVSLIIKLEKLLPAMPAIMLPIIPILAVILFSSMVAYYIEPMTKKIIRPSYQRVRELCRC